MSSPEVDTNRELWNLWTELNSRADSEYSSLLKRLKAGGTTLKTAELEELGDVRRRPCCISNVILD